MCLQGLFYFKDDVSSRQVWGLLISSLIKPLGFRYLDVMVVMGSFVYILEHNRLPHQVTA